MNSAEAFQYAMEAAGRVELSLRRQAENAPTPERVAALTAAEEEVRALVTLFAQRRNIEARGETSPYSGRRVIAEQSYPRRPIGAD